MKESELTEEIEKPLVDSKPVCLFYTIYGAVVRALSLALLIHTA